MKIFTKVRQIREIFVQQQNINPFITSIRQFS